MMLFSHVFSKPVKSMDRWNFISRLGLSWENFLFSEELPKQTLRILKFQNGAVQALLDVPSASQLPLVQLRHANYFPEYPVQREKTLTDCLLPFPWSALFSREIKAGTSLDFSDDIFKGQCQKLRDSFQRLESLLIQNEVACFQIEQKDSSAAFLFHCVRGKIIQASFLNKFNLSEQQRNLSQTSYSLSTLPSGNPLNLKGFELAFWQLQTSIENHKVFKRTSGWGSSSLDAPLEL